MAIDADGLIAIPSHHSVKETIDRLEAALKAKGIQIFARVDHGAGAVSVGMTLRPTEVLIFGHPKSGTPLMQRHQTIGIDLPLKALAWRDEADQVYLAYNDMGWLARRHGLGPDAAPALELLSTLLAGFATAAAA
jgi:uncharacterized protein (DUF302 family)